MSRGRTCMKAVEFARRHQSGARNLDDGGRGDIWTLDVERDTRRLPNDRKLCSGDQ